MAMLFTTVAQHYGYSNCIDLTSRRLSFISLNEPLVLHANRFKLGRDGSND